MGPYKHMIRCICSDHIDKLFLQLVTYTSPSIGSRKDTRLNLIAFQFGEKMEYFEYNCKAQFWSFFD